MSARSVVPSAVERTTYAFQGTSQSSRSSSAWASSEGSTSPVPSRESNECRWLLSDVPVADSASEVLDKLGDGGPGPRLDAPLPNATGGTPLPFGLEAPFAGGTVLPLTRRRVSGRLGVAPRIHSKRTVVAAEDGAVAAPAPRLSASDRPANVHPSSPADHLVTTQLQKRNRKTETGQCRACMGVDGVRTETDM